MKERPILFNGRMVRAILDGTKTQTRRPINTQLCPFGVAGDHLWVRETFAYLAPFEDEWNEQTPGGGTLEYRADTDPPLRAPGGWDNAEPDDPDRVTWTPSIHMPRWASRLTLEVTGVRVERVQDISEDDARAEGFADRAALLASWAGIYGDGDPWVWVVSFKRVEVTP